MANNRKLRDEQNYEIEPKEHDLELSPEAKREIEKKVSEEHYKKAQRSGQATNLALPMASNAAKEKRYQRALNSARNFEQSDNLNNIQRGDDQDEDDQDYQIEPGKHDVELSPEAKKEIEKKLEERYRRIQRLAQAANLALALTGRGGAGGLALAGTAAGTAGDRAQGVSLGQALKKTAKAQGKILGGTLAKRFAQKRGVSALKSSAIGGAVAGALGGQGIMGIAKSAAGWVILEIAFKSLWTLIWFIPSVAYLNLHVFLNKIGFNKLFVGMSIVQQIKFIIADFVLGIVILLLVANLLIMLWIIDQFMSGGLVTRFLS